MLGKNLSLAIGFALLSACGLEQIPRELLRLTEQSAAQRKLETRRFETGDEAALLSAGASVLKEMGFSVDHQVPEIGLLAASRQGSAFNLAEAAGAVTVGVVTQVVGVPVTLPYSQNQSMKVSLAAAPAPAGGTSLCVIFQRVVWNNEGKVSSSTLVEDPAPYGEFFSKLAKNVALDAHEI